MAHFNVPIVPLTTTQQQQQQCQRFHVRYQGVKEEDKKGLFVDSQAPLSSQHFPLSLSPSPLSHPNRAKWNIATPNTLAH